MNSFLLKIPNLSHVQLLEIIRNREDYHELAYIAAEEELKIRNLDPNQFEEAMQELDVLIAERAEKPQNLIYQAYNKIFLSFRKIVFRMIQVKNQ